MKKQRKKLILNRETLKVLDAREMGYMAGGDGPRTSNAYTNCPTWIGSCRPSGCDFYTECGPCAPNTWTCPV